jgi:putative two-component system response regulator
MHNWTETRPRLLVADDDPLARRALAATLRRAGAEVVEATDGSQVLDIIRAVSPDAVLLDVNMPGASGIDVCRRIKEARDTQLLPVMIISGMGEQTDRVAGAQAGATDYFTKPVETRELLGRLDWLVRLKRITDELEAAESVLFSLGKAIESRDPGKYGHCERLGMLVHRLARALNLPAGEQAALQRAAFVHDIGKVTVPDNILLKRGPLSNEEWEIMRRHPVAGEAICAPLKSFAPVLPIVRHHHERLDGSGYPDGLKGDSIPLTARILQIVDVYDALTTERTYKKALPSAEALAVMQSEVERGWWDPAVFRTFAAQVIEQRQTLFTPPRNSGILN